MRVDQAGHDQEAYEVDVLIAGQGCVPRRHGSLNSVNAAGGDSDRCVYGLVGPDSETSAMNDRSLFLSTAADGRIASHA
jgi:hypothetical protein